MPPLLLPLNGITQSLLPCTVPASVVRQHAIQLVIHADQQQQANQEPGVGAAVGVEVGAFGGAPVGAFIEALVGAFVRACEGGVMKAICLAVSIT